MQLDAEEKTRYAAAFGILNEIAVGKPKRKPTSPQRKEALRHKRELLRLRAERWAKREAELTS